MKGEGGICAWNEWWQTAANPTLSPAFTSPPQCLASVLHYVNAFAEHVVHGYMVGSGARVQSRVSHTLT